MTVVESKPIRAATRKTRLEGSASHPGRIVVGVDGSERSLHALDWAMREAGSRGCTLHVVMAWQHPRAYNATNVWGLGIDPWLSNDAHLSTSAKLEAVRILERFTQQGKRAKKVPIRCEAIEGHPAPVLLNGPFDFVGATVSVSLR